MVLRRSDRAANAACDAMAALCHGGYLDLYAGQQPATPDTATRASRLASVPLGRPAFGRAAFGTADANSVMEVAAEAAGTVSWFRVFASDHQTAIWDGRVGEGSNDLVVDRTDIQQGAVIQVKALSLSEAKS